MEQTQTLSEKLHVEAMRSWHQQNVSGTAATPPVAMLTGNMLFALIEHVEKMEERIRQLEAE